MGMFDYFIERVLVHEGGYVNDPRDPGLSPRKSVRNGFKCSSAPKSELDCITTTPPALRPLSQCPINSTSGISARCSEIVRLLNRCCPSAVTRLISPVVVYSVNRHAIRAFAHLCKKSSEIVAPFIAHRYAASTPQVVSRIFWVVAPVFHVRPGPIGTSFSQAVRAHGVAADFFLQAAARPSESSAELRRPNKSFSSAITQAVPLPLFVSSRAYRGGSFALDKQATVSLPN